MVSADSRGIPRVPRYSGAASSARKCFAYAPVTLFGRPFQAIRLHRGPRSVAGPTTPGGALPRPRFGLLRFRSPLLAESLLFSSPAGTEMFQFPAFAPPCGGVGIAPDGFPHSDIRGSMGICPLPRLFAACHVLLRLREPQASPMRPFRFPFFFSPFLSHRRSLDSICSITLASDCPSSPPALRQDSCQGLSSRSQHVNDLFSFIRSPGQTWTADLYIISVAL